MSDRPGTDSSGAFRLYVLRDGNLALLDTLATPEELGQRLVGAFIRGELEGGRVGVLYRREQDERGVWIASPFVGGKPRLESAMPRRSVR